jgi:hypothetical protein
MGLGQGGGAPSGIPGGSAATFQNYLMANPQLSQMIASGQIPMGVAFQMYQQNYGTPYPGARPIPPAQGGGPPPLRGPQMTLPAGVTTPPMPAAGPPTGPGGAPATGVPQGQGQAMWQLPGWMQSMALNPWTSGQAPSVGTGSLNQPPTGAAQNIPSAWSYMPANQPAPPLPGGAAGGGTFSVLPYPQIAPITGTGASTTSPLAPSAPPMPAPSPTTAAAPSSNTLSQAQIDWLNRQIQITRTDDTVRGGDRR